MLGQASRGPPQLIDFSELRGLRNIILQLLKTCFNNMDILIQQMALSPMLTLRDR